MSILGAINLPRRRDRQWQENRKLKFIKEPMSTCRIIESNHCHILGRFVGFDLFTLPCNVSLVDAVCLVTLYHRITKH